MRDPQDTQTEVERGRCCECGRLAVLVTKAEGFAGLGWCAACERENRQPELELVKAVTK
jgi:hypothetical protein